jgi:hypothetical protein
VPTPTSKPDTIRVEKRLSTISGGVFCKRPTATPPEKRPKMDAIDSLCPQMLRCKNPDMPKTDPFKVMRSCTGTARVKPPRKAWRGAGADMMINTEETETKVYSRIAPEYTARIGKTATVHVY